MMIKTATVTLVLAAALTVRSAPHPTNLADPPGSEACAGCHAQIYRSYSKTAMANASGMATDGLISGGFFHPPSKVQYRVYLRDGRAWMSYDRHGDHSLKGERELLYFIGSGRKGRSYLFSLKDFLFESPINWYSQEGRWNMAPAYTEATTIPMNLPSFTDCLNCHVSGMQPPVSGTENKFSGKPFLHAGITCERCHGSPEAHLDGKGPIINPSKLDPERRDAVCMECHFEGTVAIKQPDKSIQDFRPGEKLSDYIHYFIVSSNIPNKNQAISQFEALSLSVCKRRSGDRMSCTSCHDPHYEPSAAERPSYFRNKCLACHTGSKFVSKHHPETPDCTKCHMPPLPSKDVAHTQATDHRILRYVSDQHLADLNSNIRLVAFPPSTASQTTTRDLALAWETLAERKISNASREAGQYLEKAVRERPNDATLLAALGYIRQEHGNIDEARSLYERALKLDPKNNDAATNLGVLEARSGHMREAVTLWQGAFERMPYRGAIGMNLATAFCLSGQTEVARSYVQQVLDYDPDHSNAKKLIDGLNASPIKCNP